MDGGDAMVWREQLGPAERAAVAALKADCDRHDGVDQPLHLESGDCPTLLHEVDGALAGVATLQITAPIEACGLVAPKFRRRGIGRAMLEAVSAECRRRTRGLLLTIEERSEAGKAFAAAVGARYKLAEYRLELTETPADRAWSPPIELRPATLADVDTFTRIGAAAFRELLSPHRVERAEREIRAGLHRHYLGELGGRPVATARLSMDDDAVYVTAFAVLPELQGRGIGRQVLTRVVRGLVEEGRAPIRIEVETENRNALGLYKSCGFSEIAAYGYYEVDV